MNHDKLHEAGSVASHLHFNGKDSGYEAEKYRIGFRDGYLRAVDELRGALVEMSSVLGLVVPEDGYKAIKVSAMVRYLLEELK